MLDHSLKSNIRKFHILFIITTAMKITRLVLLVLLLSSCQNKLETKEKSLVQTTYGKQEFDNDSLDVELDTSKFNKWTDFLERFNEIVCNDSVPRITLTNQKEVKHIYFLNACWEKDELPCMRQSISLSIHNNKLRKYFDNTYLPLDSLESIFSSSVTFLEEESQMNGEPTKQFIYITYDKINEFKTLPTTLDSITEAYNQATKKTDIHILLVEKLPFPPAPPPPPAYH